MEDMEYSGLLYADVEYVTASGEVFLKIKKKDAWGPIFYVFEKNEELLSDEEKIKFKKDWRLITKTMGKAGIKLFDSSEIMEAIQAQIDKVLESEDAERAMAEADETGEFVLVRDIEISLFDHGTGRIVSLTLGISVPAGASENIKRWRKLES